MFSKVLYVLSIVLFIISCSREEDLISTKDNQFDILDAKYIDYPISDYIEIPRKDRYLYVDYAYILSHHNIDSNGHLNVNYQGQRSYHPVRLLAFATAVSQGYSFKPDTIYNYISFKQLEALFERASRINGGLYFQYDFDFALHGYEDELLQKNWSSGMAQGYGLYTLSQLYRNTSNEKYLAYADSIINTFVNIKSTSPEKWTTYIDDEGLYWISEYPLTDGSFSQALNGFIFGFSGLYEIYLVTKSDRVKILMNRSIETLKEIIPRYRKEADISYYCLKHNVQSEKYHHIHIEQFQYLFDITRDSTFINYKNTFTDDHFN